MMMDEMKLTPNVVEATNKEGLIQKLEILQKELTLCEKALAEYLETKRLTFPRFYFVSSADLLDILSNGNQPKTVAR
jgi:dynein heavy chain